MRTKQKDNPTLQLKPEVPEKTPLWRHHHVLDVDDFTAEEIETVFNTTRAMKEVLSRPIKRVPTLRGKTMVNLFYEPSTRTRLSFELAAKYLSADVVNLNASVSSVAKGESLVDTLGTLQALGADIIVMRHPHSGAPYIAARYIEARIVNAGDGWHAHPTQALLDLYTISEHKHKPSLKGLKAVIIGDIMHSRVARSNMWGLTTMGIEVTLCCPPTLLPIGLGEEQLPPVNIEPSIELALDKADIVMTLRLQRERQKSGLLPSIREYIQLYQLTEARLGRAKPDALVLHPGPVNEGVEISPAVAHGKQSVINEQVSNGVAVRMALLYLLSGSQKQ